MYIWENMQNAKFKMQNMQNARYTKCEICKIQVMQNQNYQIKATIPNQTIHYCIFRRGYVIYQIVYLVEAVNAWVGSAFGCFVWNFSLQSLSNGIAGRILVLQQ